jgi:hypothetical protein
MSSTTSSVPRSSRAGSRSRAAARTADLVEIVEVPDHPWFVGVQFHPELKSRPNEPHPLFVAFVGAALAHRGTPAARGASGAKAFRSDREMSAHGPVRHIVTIGSGPRKVAVGGGLPLAVLAGPCVVESERLVMDVAERLVDVCDRFGLPLVFKSSIRKPTARRSRPTPAPATARGSTR